MARKGPVIGKKQAELNRFVNWVRTTLGLDPIRTHHNIARAQVTDLSRFGVTHPIPWHHSRTPMRGSGN